jgi:hypothetical protein
MANESGASAASMISPSLITQLLIYLIDLTLCREILALAKKARHSNAAFHFGPPCTQTTTSMDQLLSRERLTCGGASCRNEIKVEGGGKNVFAKPVAYLRDHWNAVPTGRRFEKGFKI